MIPYTAPWWLPGGHLQTLYAALLAPRTRVDYLRERWETPDGDFVDVDYVDVDETSSERTEGNPGFPPLPPLLESDIRRVRQWRTAPGDEHNPPLVVLFHGLEGRSASHYAHALMSHVASIGWRGVVIHFRGCSGEPNRLPRAYHSGDSTEIDWMLRRLRASNEGATINAVGVSLGGNALLKWLGEQGDSARSVVGRACAVSAPMDLMAAGDALGRGFNLVYTRAFLSTLKRKSLVKARLYPGLYDAGLVRAARTLRAFDNVVTAPLHGFRDTDDYWTRASSKPWLARIAVPTLVLNARNDPFLPQAALPRPHDVSSAVCLEFPDDGGHVGFVNGRFPGHLEWLPRRIIEFFSAGLSG